MRHLRFGKKLSRDTNARKALLNNLAKSVIINGQLTTTLTKAKFAQSYVEKLVTVAKNNRLQPHRKIASKLNNDAFLKLIKGYGPIFQERDGGYTRILKLSTRRGDNAKMAKLEFVEIPPVSKKEEVVKKNKKVATHKSTEKNPHRSSKRGSPTATVSLEVANNLKTKPNKKVAKKK